MAKRVSPEWCMVIHFKILRLHILICHHSSFRNHPTIVPFRESKLTRLFQSYFHGKGKASMVVNISPCASVFDETYNVLKFSSVAKEVMMISLFCRFQSAYLSIFCIDTDY